MSERPHGRKRTDSGKTADVHKRGSGIGGGPSGNGNYNGRDNKSSGMGLGVRAGGGLGVVALILMMLFGNGGLGGGTQTPEPTPTPTPAATPAATHAPTNSNGFHFGTQASQQTTYTNASSQSVSTTVASGSRDKYTKLKGNGKDTVTILVYMCGTDLESNYGMATADINEMAYAAQSDKVNIILETGGTKRWKNNIMTSGTNQLWRVREKALEALNTNLGRKPMTDAATLAEFIQFGVKNYPADRYMLIFWDHGGGSVTGYGYDELYPNGSMSVDKIASALEAGGTKFDIIGFDACLMANMETAVAVEPYADYLLASEETEPGTGWYYTEWLGMLANNTSVSSLELGQKVIDDFCTKKQSGSTSSDKNTLSLVDLAEFKNTVPDKMSAFAKTISNSVQTNNYQSVADARSNTKEFASSTKIDQVDLVHFASIINNAESKALIQALQGCVKYNRTRNVNNAYGMSIYFPYRNTRYVNAVLNIYNTIGFDKDYSNAVKSFATLEASGQIMTQSTSNSLFDMLGGAPSSNGYTISSGDIFDMLTGGSGASTLDSLLGGSSAYDSSAIDLFSALFGRSHLDSADLVLSERDGQKVLALSEDDWAQVQKIKLNVWVDDGEGYIDLGLDDIYEFNENNELIVDYDNMWLAINGEPVSYYHLSNEYTDESNYSITGYIPALLNNEEVHLLVEFSDENPGGVVLGAEKIYDTGTDGKLIPIAFTDEEDDNEVIQIDFICDYYDYDGNFSDRYLMSEPLVFEESNGDTPELTVEDVTLENGSLIYGYVLTDIYNSDRWTPMLKK